MSTIVTIGIDEVGRGCWAGPLVAGAVILDKPITGLRDSKRLSQLQRDRLNDQIILCAAAVGLGWVWPLDIDKYGVTWSVKRAMEQAVTSVAATIDIEHCDIIIDGHYNFLPEFTSARAMIKADDCIPAVSAASIVAKVARDRYMVAIASQYPEYGFDRNVGYGTAQHIRALAMHGVTDIHRQSYKPVAAVTKQYVGA